MVQLTGVQSQIESYQRHKKWYLIPSFLTLSNIRWGSRVEWCDPGNDVAPSLAPRGVVVIERGAFATYSLENWNKVKSDVLLWTFINWLVSFVWPTRSYTRQFYARIDGRQGRIARRVLKIRAINMTSWYEDH